MNLATRIVPLEFDIFVGMDVDKRSIAMTVGDHHGIHGSFKVSYDPGAIIKYARKAFGGKRIAFAYEVGPTGYHLHDRLVAAAYTCLVVAPSNVPVERGQRVKTNRLDSKKLLENLRGGQLRGIRVPSADYRALRHTTGLRNSLSKQIVATKCRIKALLTVENIPFPKTATCWTGAVLKELEGLDCAPAVRFKLDKLLESLRFLHKQVLDVQKEVRRLCLEDPDIADSIRYLMSIPGVGWILASNLIARIGDWRLLRSANEIASFVGLTPAEYSTGEGDNKLRITRAGDSKLRNMLVEAAWVAIKHDPELAAFYRGIYARQPKNRAARKAIVAVARKMTTRIYRVLKDRRFYEVRIPVYEIVLSD